MTKAFFKATDMMCDLVSQEYRLLQLMSRFGIPTGFEERSVDEVCKCHGVDTMTFLAIANFMKESEESASYYADKVNVEALVNYLESAHTYYLRFQLPQIRTKLLTAIDCAARGEVALMLLRFFDEYTKEVKKHMDFESNKIFSYVRGLLNGAPPEENLIASFSDYHVGMQVKLQELKNIILKYYSPSEEVHLVNAALFDIFICEEDMATHCGVENYLFVPAVRLLEQRLSSLPPQQKKVSEEQQEQLSNREREIIACLVGGMTNKQIADKLNISINTVLTHRKNITKKLDIRSVAGLTIYAIAHNIVKIDDIRAI
jgi:regulator of cell morphogenesis and NO signaling